VHWLEVLEKMSTPFPDPTKPGNRTQPENGTWIANQIVVPKDENDEVNEGKEKNGEEEQEETDKERKGGNGGEEENGEEVDKEKKKGNRNGEDKEGKEKEEEKEEEEEEEEEEEDDEFDMTEAPPEDEVSPFQEKIGSLIHHMTDLQPKVLPMKRMGSKTASSPSSPSSSSSSSSPSVIPTVVPGPLPVDSGKEDDDDVKKDDLKKRSTELSGSLKEKPEKPSKQEKKQEHEKKILQSHGPSSSLLFPGSTFTPSPTSKTFAKLPLQKKQEQRLSLPITGADPQENEAKSRPSSGSAIRKKQKLKENDWAASVTKKFKANNSKKKSELQLHSLPKRSLSPALENTEPLTAERHTTSFAVLPPQVQDPPPEDFQKRQNTAKKRNNKHHRKETALPKPRGGPPPPLDTSDDAGDMEIQSVMGPSRKSKTCRSVFSKTAVFFLGVFSTIAGSEIMYRLLPCS
jgi:hypothetical protein